MAFCNSCGATLSPGTSFCAKCGAANSGAPAASPSPAARPLPAPPPGSGSSSTLKVILIVVGVIFLIGILGIAAISFIGYRIAKSAKVTQSGDNVKVETPFGSVESSKDPEKVAKDLSIDVYPGAEIQRNGAATATFGGIHTVTANFESTDSVDKVCAFYKSRLPAANVTTADQNRCTIVSNNPPNMVTLNIESNGDGSKFLITSVTKK